MSLDVAECVNAGKMSKAVRSTEDLRKLSSGDYIPKGKERGENVVIINGAPHIFIGTTWLLLETLSRDVFGNPQINHFPIKNLEYDSSGKLIGEIFGRPRNYGNRFSEVELAGHYEDLLNNAGIGGRL